MSLAIIVDRKRFGLVHHALCMSKFCTECNIENEVFIPGDMLDDQNSINSKEFKINMIFKRKYDKIVIWSFGISILFIPLFRLVGKRVIFVHHEPGGLKQRLTKGDKIYYAIAVSMLEFLFLKFANVIGTPNRKNAFKYGVHYMPLLFSNRTHRSAPVQKKIVYLGRKDSRRSYESFMSSDFRLELCDFKLDEFPKGKLVSETDKENLLSDASAVFNVYTCEHNQSGVTGDALSQGVRVIISKYDAWAEVLKNTPAALIVEPTLTPSQLAFEIRRFLDNSDANESIYSVYEENFGRLAFDLFWKDLLT